MINENAALKRKLERMFDDDPDGRAFVWVELKSKFDERMYGSAQYVTREKLKNRKFKYSQDSTGMIRLSFLDSLYNPKTFRWTKPL